MKMEVWVPVVVTATIFIRKNYYELKVKNKGSTGYRRANYSECSNSSSVSKTKRSTSGGLDIVSHL